MTGSDHKMLKSEIISNKLEFIPTRTTHRYNWQKAKWTEFREYLKEKMKVYPEEWENIIQHLREQNMEIPVIEITTLLKEPADKFVPMHNPSSRSKPWWNEEIQTKRKQLHSALKNYEEVRDQSKWREYKDQHLSFFKTIRTRKRNQWDKFLAEARGKDIFTAMKYSIRRRCEKTPTLHTRNSTPTTFAGQVAMFRETLFSPPPEFHLTEAEGRNTRTLSWNKATSGEITKEINTSASSKAPRPDGIGFKGTKIQVPHSRTSNDTYSNRPWNHGKKSGKPQEKRGPTTRPRQRK